MPRLLAVIAFGLSLAPQAAPLQSQQPQAPPQGAISGMVIDAITGQPLAGATVTLSRIGTIGLPPGSLRTPRVVTDARGRFVYAGLEPADDYYLGARRPGYEYTRYGWTAPGQTLVINDIHRITVGSGQWVADIKIPLWQLPVIGGRVVDERGEPVIGVAVRAFSQATLGGQPQLVGSNVVTTDDRGFYRIPGLAPGRYVVSVLSVQSTVLATTPESRVSRTPGELTTGGVGVGVPGIAGPTVDLDGRHRLAITNFATPPPPSSTQSRAYAAQFYPGVGTAAEATQLDLEYRQSRVDIDFQLRPVPAVRVSGHVEGVPSPGVLLRLMPAGSEGLGFGSEAATTLLDPDGTFTFFNVPAGRYTLMSRSTMMSFTTGATSVRLPDAPGFGGFGAGVGSRNGTPALSYISGAGPPSASWGRMSLTVGSENIDNLVFPMYAAGKISGRLAFAEGFTPPANAHIRITAEPANGDPSIDTSTGTAALTNGVYTFSIGGLTGGTYLIEASPYYEVSITAGGRDVTMSGIDLSASREVTDVVVTLTDKRQEIRGVVSGTSGRTAGIIAFPVDPRLWTNYGWNATNFYTTRTGSTGAFVSRPTWAGDFYLIAVDIAQIDAWTDPRFLAAAAPLATRISVAWGDVKTLDLQWRDVVYKK